MTGPHGPIPSYSKLGQSARDVLVGGKEGTFQYNTKASVSAKTLDGIDYTATITKQDKDTMAVALRTAYTADMLKFAGTFTQAGKIVASVTATDLAPGLTAVLSGTVPDIKTAKLGLDYVLPRLTVNSSVSLTSSPIIDVAATTGRSDMFVGGQFVFSSEKNDITAWTVGAGLTRKDFQVAVTLLDKAHTVKAVYAHRISPTAMAAAEVVRNLNKADDTTAIAVGYQQRLEAGALAKIRVESNGLTSLHYETQLQPKNKVALSAQLDAKDLNKAPKLGFSLDAQH